MTSRNRDFFQMSAHSRPMAGDTKTSALDMDHIGWLKCDGRSLSKADFLVLFNVIGYSFGGSGSNFFLPDPRGCVPGFVGSNSGLYTSPRTNRALGDLVGEETHTLTIAEMPTHNHTGTTSNATTGITHNASGPSGNGYGLAYQDGNNTMNAGVNPGPEPNLYQPLAALVLTDPGHNHNFTTNNTGGSNAHNNMQPTIFVGSLFIYSGKATYGATPFSYNPNNLPIV